MEQTFNDFKQKYLDLKGKRVRISFHIPEMGGQSKGYECIGRILEVDEETSCLKIENDPQDDEFIKFIHLNIQSVAVYAIDEIDEEADLSDKPEAKFPHGTLIKSTPINEANQFVEEGWVIHETFAKTVTLLKYKEEEE